MIDTVFIDMDGVLADFVKSMAARCNYTEQEFKALGYMNVQGIVRDEISADPTFFKTLEPTRYFGVIKQFMKIAKYRGAEVNILTSMGGDFYGDMNATTYSAKTAWIEKFLSDVEIDNFIAVPKCYMKKAYALPGSLLVDDMPSNCNGFREAGGDAIQVDIGWTAEQAYNAFEAAATEYFGV